eukprot:CAMPEP_0184672596 /NCGR_PEP_ID=MMETSP0308-20130426/86191_1 /TAXON_ID=38269 /ORGANISM="Gloeochaete witrockiana, Strain SAG 46.84" /LENGTH=130 /DNA_ID=CAMNT_0027119951 /DNA_START=3314 /DNA_END=3706 /DNA_ORIENTATION=+
MLDMSNAASLQVYLSILAGKEVFEGDPRFVGVLMAVTGRLDGVAGRLLLVGEFLLKDGVTTGLIVARRDAERFGVGVVRKTFGNTLCRTLSCDRTTRGSEMRPFLKAAGSCASFAEHANIITLANNSTQA